MRQLNLPKKYTAMGQVWVSVLLIVLATVFAFTPMITLDLTDNETVAVINNALDTFMDSLEDTEKAKDSLDEIDDPSDILGAITGDEEVTDESNATDATDKIVKLPEKIEFPEKVDVTTGKIINSISILVKYIDVAMADRSTLTSTQLKELEAKKQDLTELLNSKEGQESIIMVLALFMDVVDFSDVKDAAENELGDVINTELEIDEDGDVVPATDKKEEQKEEKSTIGAIVNKIISIIVMIYMLCYIVIWPFTLLIIAIVMLIKALVARKNPEKVAGKIGGALIKPLGFVVTAMLLLTFMPHFTLGSGMKLMFALCVTSVAVNLVVSRLRAYHPLDFKYVNLAQGASAVKLVGFAIFFSNVLKTGFLRSFVDSCSDYFTKMQIDVAAINLEIMAHNEKFPNKHWDTFSPSATYLIDLALMVIAAMLALGVCVSLIKSVAAGLGLTSNKKASKPGALGDGICALVVCILPIIASLLKNKVYYSLDTKAMDKAKDVLIIDEEVVGSIFNMSDDGKSALIGMIIGAIIILVADIAFLVLKGMFCADINENQEANILSGKAPVVALAAPAAVTEGAPVVGEAPATEEAAEEAPTADNDGAVAADAEVEDENKNV